MAETQQEPTGSNTTPPDNTPPPQPEVEPQSYTEDGADAQVSESSPNKGKPRKQEQLTKQQAAAQARAEARANVLPPVPSQGHRTPPFKSAYAQEKDPQTLHQIIISLEKDLINANNKLTKFSDQTLEIRAAKDRAAALQMEIDRLKEERRTIDRDVSLMKRDIEKTPEVENNLRLRVDQADKDMKVLREELRRANAQADDEHRKAQFNEKRSCQFEIECEKLRKQNETLRQRIRDIRPQQAEEILSDVSKTKTQNGFSLSSSSPLAHTPSPASSPLKSSPSPDSSAEPAAASQPGDAAASAARPAAEASSASSGHTTTAPGPAAFPPSAAAPLLSPAPRPAGKGSVPQGSAAPPPSSLSPSAAPAASAPPAEPVTPARPAEKAQDSSLPPSLSPPQSQSQPQPQSQTQKASIRAYRTQTEQLQAELAEVKQKMQAMLASKEDIIRKYKRQIDELSFQNEELMKEAARRERMLVEREREVKMLSIQMKGMTQTSSSSSSSSSPAQRGTRANASSSLSPASSALEPRQPLRAPAGGGRGGAHPGGPANRRLPSLSESSQPSSPLQLATGEREEGDGEGELYESGSAAGGASEREGHNSRAHRSAPPPRRRRRVEEAGGHGGDRRLSPSGDSGSGLNDTETDMDTEGEKVDENEMNDEERERARREKKERKEQKKQEEQAALEEQKREDREAEKNRRKRERQSKRLWSTVKPIDPSSAS